MARTALRRSAELDRLLDLPAPALQAAEVPASADVSPEAATIQPDVVTQTATAEPEPPMQTATTEPELPTQTAAAHKHRDRRS